VLVAERHLDSLLSLCSEANELQAACAVLRRWDRKAELDSAGYLLFERIWQAVVALGSDVWTPYNASDPLNVRVVLRVTEPTVAAKLRTAFTQAVQSLLSQGMPLDARLVDYQFVMHGNKPIPLFGGPEGLGIYGRMDAVPATGPGSRPGQRRAIGGATHIQAVDFDANGPRNLSFLAQSQSADPRSPHIDDLTQMLARKQPVSFPFREDEIKADPQLTVIRISE
jgi:acyl-homoserine-lactone acylase